MLETVLAGANQGLILAVLALGVYISFRVLDFADLTCEGSFTMGASVAAMLIWRGVPSLLAVLIAALGGTAAGAVTGLLHTKLKIPPILAGILTMISLYSINIHLMSMGNGTPGTSNLSLLPFMKKTVYSRFNSLLGIGKTYSGLLLGVLSTAAIIAFLYWFFGTEFGSAIRATGSNEMMCRAQGMNTDLFKVAGLAISDGLIAMSGALLCQYQNFAEVNMGVGTIVIGLAAIIIGETVFAAPRNFALRLCSVAVGSVIYRVVVAIVIYSGMPSTDLKLMTAAIVTVALSLPMVKKALAKKNIGNGGKIHG